MQISTALMTLTLLIGRIESQTPSPSDYPSISIELSASEVRVGDNVTFTCTVTSLLSGTVLLHKAVAQPEGKPSVINDPISVDHDLSKFYRNLGRFSILKTTEGQDQQLFILSITGVKLEDSGGYGCTVTGHDDLFALKVLEVYRKPTSISFNPVDRPANVVGNKTVVVVRENETPNITCRVPDIMPKASVGILLEREVLIGPKVITDDFDVKVIQNIYHPQADSAVPTPLHNSYTMEATNRGFNVSFNQDNKTLTCIARMTTFDKDNVTAEITLQVLYVPKIVCAGIWNTTVNSTDLVILCRVFSNPPSQGYNKSVSIQEKGRIVVVRPGDKDTSLYSLHDTVVPNSEEKVSIMAFTIKTVTEDHFTYYYTFYAANSEGPSTKTIRIEKSLTPVEDGVEGILKGGSRSLPLVVLLFSTAKLFVSW